MTIKETFICPKCGNTQPTVLAIQALMEDVRYDVLKCPDCGTEWRVYYKVSEVNAEVTFVPQDPIPAAPVADPEDTEAAESSK